MSQSQETIVKSSIPVSVQLWQMATGHMIARAIHVAGQLGIADLLKEGPKSIIDLAETLNVHENSLYRLLRTLSSQGIFKEIENRKFELTPLAEPLLTDSPNSIRNGAMLAGEQFHWNSWGNLLHSIKTGDCAFEYVHGKELFDYLAENPSESIPYYAWMTQATELQIKAILASYDFSEFQKIADIGGGQGRLLSAILTKYPEMHGILFDIPEVITNTILKDNPNIKGRYETIKGDFFSSIPSNADLYILKTVIHDWDDELSIRILRNCSNAMSDQSKILLIEMVIPNERKPHPGFMMDLNMMVLTHGGLERTESEYRDLYKSAGIIMTRVIPTNTPISIIEGTKA